MTGWPQIRFKPVSTLTLGHPHDTRHAWTPWRRSRTLAVVTLVVSLHAAALWGLQHSRLQMRPPELLVPAVIVAELVTPPPVPVVVPRGEAKPSTEPEAQALQEPKPIPAPEPEPEPTPTPEPDPVPEPEVQPIQPALPEPVPKPAPRPKLAPRPKPKTHPRPTPAPEAAPVPRPAAVEPAPATTETKVAQAPQSVPAAAPVALPSASAAYLNNPPPEYPRMSRRLGESGRVVVRVLIGTDGRASQARIQRSSGYERLDQTALQTVRDRWRFQPGTRAGIPEAMWFDVPINFVLE